MFCNFRLLLRVNLNLKISAAKMSSELFNQPCNTLVFFDLETTGLPSFHNPRITELSFCAIDKAQFLCGAKPNDMPRVTNRLNLCIYPCRLIDPVASEKTLLYTDMLGSQSPFNEDVVNIISSFLDRLNKPICLIAHNGIRFDFPILKSELEKLGKVIAVINKHIFTHFLIIFLFRNSLMAFCVQIPCPYSK